MMRATSPEFTKTPTLQITVWFGGAINAQSDRASTDREFGPRLLKSALGLPQGLFNAPIRNEPENCDEDVYRLCGPRRTNTASHPGRVQ